MPAQLHLTDILAPGLSHPSRPGIAQRLLAWLRAVDDASRQRRRLVELEEHLLRDIGITRAEALHEASKPLWRR